MTDRSPEARLRDFVRLIEEEIADQDGGPNASYCWWCQNDVNGIHGPQQPHAENCWVIRARALLTEEASLLPVSQESETWNEEAFCADLAEAIGYVNKIVVESDGYPMSVSWADMRTLLVNAYLEGKGSRGHGATESAQGDESETCKPEKDINEGRCEHRQPKTGYRCGLPKDHDGHSHTILIPTGAPWFPEVAARSSALADKEP